MENKVEEVRELLQEPNISGMDWELGKAILTNWKAGLPERICQLFEPKPDESRLLTELEKLLEHYFSKELGEGASDDIAREILSKVLAADYLPPEEVKKEREKVAESISKKVLDLIIQHDPRTCPKINLGIMTQQEIDKAYKAGSETILEWEKVVGEILKLFVKIQQTRAGAGKTSCEGVVR